MSERQTEQQSGTAALLHPSSDGDRADQTTSQDRPVDADTDIALLSEESGNEYRRRWEETQHSFVDQPREAVKQADELVADLIRELAAGFAGARQQLETQWDRGEDVSTEDLRLTLQRYRSFFRRLTAV